MVWQPVIDFELSAGGQYPVGFQLVPNERIGLFLESDPRPDEIYWRYSVIFHLIRQWGNAVRPSYRVDRVFSQKWEIRVPAPPPENVGYNATWLNISVPPSSRLCAGTKLFVWRDV